MLHPFVALLHIKSFKPNPHRWRCNLMHCGLAGRLNSGVRPQDSDPYDPLTWNYHFLCGGSANRINHHLGDSLRPGHFLSRIRSSQSIRTPRIILDDHCAPNRSGGSFRMAGNFMRFVGSILRYTRHWGLTIRSSRNRFVTAKAWQEKLAMPLLPLRGSA